MSCALCLRDAKLRKSHIIPEFLYKPLYDSKNRFHVLATTAHRPRPFQQKGIRERLLCGTCEGRLSKWEKYARGVLFGGEELVCTERGHYFSVSGVDYKRMKLFQMSILWRAGVACHQIFSRVQLGPHAEQLRRMIHAGVPGRADKYPCLMFQVLNNDGEVVDFIDQPTRLRFDGIIAYRFIFAGFLWVYLVPSHQKSQRRRWP
jgi:hypothetical protein